MPVATRPAPLARRLRLGAWIDQWLNKPADTQRPIVLDARRIYILPSGGGILFAVALVVMLLGAINYDLGLGHALVFLLVGLGLVGMVHTWRNLLGLQLNPGRAEPVFVGQTALIPCLVESQDRITRRALELAVAGEIAGTELDILPGDSRRAMIPCTPERRGRHTIERLLITSRYPLGLFTAWSAPRPLLEVLAYPAPEFHPLPTLTVASASGLSSGQTGQDDFAGLRTYRPSDSPRHIAWKAVARDLSQRTLLVKQFSGGSSGELILDWAQSCRHAPSTDRERRLAVLTGWVLTAEAQRLAYGLHLPGHRIPIGTGPAHRAACLEALALFPSSPEAQHG